MNLSEDLKAIERKPAEGRFFPPTEEEKQKAAREKNLKKLSQVLIGWNDPVEDEQTILSIQGVSISCLKNISLVLGLKKSGKSTFQSLLMGDQSQIIVRSFPPGKSGILYCDTEQSGKYIRKLQDRISKLSGLEPSNIQFLKLRGLSKKERLEYIKLAIELYPSTALVLIDNIKDISQDFNDLNEADKTASQLVQWAQQYNIHIMCVLHLNKGNGLSRGHLGSELENKAETIIKIRKDEVNNLVVVEPEATRDKPFEKFGFYFDSEGSPVIAESPKATASKKGTGKAAWEQSELLHLNLLDEVFKNTSEFGYEPMWRAIKSVANKHSINLGDNTAKDWLSHYKNNGMIKQNEKHKYIRGSV